MIFSGTARRTGRARCLPRLLAYAELLEYLVDGFGGGAATGKGKERISGLLQTDRDSVQRFTGLQGF